MIGRNNITIDESLQQFPFLKNLLKNLPENTKHNPLMIEVLEIDNDFLNLSLMENESEAFGHGNVRQTLYVAYSDNSFHHVFVKRSSRKIYPPEYLHPDLEYPPDDDGKSETIHEALSRENLTEHKYVILHKIGFLDGWSSIPFNNLAIASVKDKLKK
ncbi:MAG: hypothetical protein V1698_02500 [bacterium]